MITGIVGVVLGLCCGVFAIPIGIVAAVLGFLGRKKVQEGQANNDGQAKAGLILGIAGVVVSIVSTVVSVMFNLGTGTGSF